MSKALISLALPMATLLSGMGTMVGSLFLEKANLPHKDIVRNWLIIWSQLFLM